MRKRTGRKGHLIQKRRPIEIKPDDVFSRHATEGLFRITATDSSSTKAWIIGEYTTFKEAKTVVDNSSTTDVNYYIHSDSSRVLYSRKGNN